LPLYIVYSRIDSLEDIGASRLTPRGDVLGLKDILDVDRSLKKSGFWVDLGFITHQFALI
jgi:hypothetical protein